MLRFDALDLSKGISIDEAYMLADIKGKDLYALLDTARRIRDRRGRVITYSRKVFIPLTYLCRDNCSYCTYKKEPSEVKIMLSPEEALSIAEEGKRHGCTEALIVTGERPEQRYPEAKEYISSLGFSSTPQYIAYLSELILNKTGLLPHTNAGILNRREMLTLRESNPSLGSMLENVSERLSQKGMPHEHAPSKNPKARIKMLEDAGILRIPFTTGLLIGIGETIYEVIDSLFTIRSIHERYKHIQELIIQNFSPKSDTPMAFAAIPSKAYILKIVALARLIMPDMNIQIPPNLNPDYTSYLDAGINDFGGISPVTIDHVNPESPWPNIDDLSNAIKSKGFQLRARLPVYPEYISGEFLSERVLKRVREVADEDGLVKRGMNE